MKRLIKNGTLLLPGGRQKANLLLEGGRIAQIGTEEFEADQVVDAEGCFVLPGFIDPHTHLELSPDHFGRDTEAAALGGCTSVLEFANQFRGESMMQGFEKWMDWAIDSTVNYGFHMSLSAWDEAHLRELDKMDEVGVASYKMYMVYDDLRVNDGEIYGALRGIRAHGGILGVHCENWDLLKVITEEVYRSGITSAEGHPLSRPVPVEAEAVARFLRIAQLAESPAYVVHLSSREGLEEIRRARARGQEVYVETCPQYLLLTDDCYNREDGVKYMMSPPLRKAKDTAALWEALAAGEIDTVGTDHCSFPLADRLAHRDDFRKVPNGCAGLQHRGQLLYTYGVCENRITLEQMVSVLSAHPARIFGVSDRGELVPGKAADVVVWDPSYRGIITDTNHHHACDSSVYAGFAVKGRARDVFINGAQVVENGELIRSGGGRYLRCGPGLHYRETQK
ncbi:MAG: dihydropyrimidinase [Oscillibacter sp.]|jgi:dihydropyrimidinase|nr:dihydropyrimidinase [Oscillibacter sp.]